MLALLAENKLLLVVFTNRYGLKKTKTKTKAFARSIAAYQTPGDVLICSSNDFISGVVAVIGVIT